jgi:hypothetical protein
MSRHSRAGLLQEASSGGFRKIARFIFGGNTRPDGAGAGEAVAMTSPVRQELMVGLHRARCIMRACVSVCVDCFVLVCTSGVPAHVYRVPAAHCSSGSKISFVCDGASRHGRNPRPHPPKPLPLPAGSLAAHCNDVTRGEDARSPACTLCRSLQRWSPSLDPSTWLSPQVLPPEAPAALDTRLGVCRHPTCITGINTLVLHSDPDTR